VGGGRAFRALVGKPPHHFRAPLRSKAFRLFRYPRMGLALSQGENFLSRGKNFSFGGKTFPSYRKKIPLWRKRLFRREKSIFFQTKLFSRIKILLDRFASLAMT
jgi:hypothetical protein